MVSEETKGPFLLGDAVKLGVTLDVVADTNTLVIKDPNNTEIVNGSLTSVTDKVYSYVYQSSSSGLYGRYLVTMTFTYNGKTSVYQTKFYLNSQC